MKKMIFNAALALLVLALGLTSCRKDYDDDINAINNRLSKLEQSINTINSDIVSLKAFVSALETGKYITKVENTSPNDGYVITFSDGTNITVNHGTKGANALTIGIEKDPVTGIYYWVLASEDGTSSYILDENGDKIPVSSAAPTIDVDDNGYWTVNGVRLLDSSNQPIKAKGEDGADGDSFFSNVEIINNSMKFTFADNTVIYIPFSPYTIEFNDDTNGIITIDDTQQTYTVMLSSNLTKNDFLAFSAEVKGKAGGDIDVATRSAAGWGVTVTAPIFDASGNITEMPTVTITPPAAATPQTANGLLILSLISTKGETTTTTRAIQATNLLRVSISRGESTFGYYATIKEALADAQAGDIIELAEGNHPLTVDPAAANSNTDWYLKVDIPNLTIKGEANKNVTIYGLTETPNASHATQNLITVAAAGFTLENVTVMPKPGTEINKLIEIIADGSHTFRSCKFVPNSIIAGAPQDNAGSLLVNSGKNATATVTIEKCEFKYAEIRLYDASNNVVVNVNNNTFDNFRVVSGTKRPIIRSYNTNTPGTGITAADGAIFNISGNTFTNVTPTPNNNAEGAVILNNFGVFNLGGNTFPTGDCYWALENSRAKNKAHINIDNDSNWQVGSYWITDRSEPDSWANDGSFITFKNKSTPVAPNSNSYFGKGSYVGMTPSDSWKVEAEVQIDAAEVGIKMGKSMWVKVANDQRTASNEWAVIEYSTAGGTAEWRVFDNGNGWITASTAHTATGYHKLAIEFKNSTLYFYVDGTEIHSSPISTYLISTNKSYAERVILQAQTGASGEVYTSSWKVPTVSKP